MDGANWRPTQGADPAAGVDPNAAAPAGGDWCAHLQPEARSRIVNEIMETLKKHLPLSVPEGLNELQKIAVQFEEEIYTAATNQSDYLRKISQKMFSMEAPKPQGPQQPPGNAQVIPNQNPSGPAPGLPPQGSNPAQSSAIPLMSQQQARQPNTSTSVQASSLSNLGQPGVSQTSTLQNMSGMPQNTMNNGLAQGASQDIYAAQRQMAGRQQQQQQSQNQLIYQQQQILMKQKLQQNSLMQPHIQQQQSLLQSTQMQSSQQPMMQMSSSLQTGQSTIPQTQPMTMQSATQSGIQQNPLNSVQQSVQSLLQQPPQSGVRQQQQPQPSMHQQPSLQHAQPTQQPNIPLQQQQQQLMGQQPNLQQNQLIGQQNGAVEMQQQQRLPVQSNNLLNMQQTQQMLNQQSMPLHQPQQLGSQANMPSLQQQQLLGTVPNVSNIQRMHMLQTKASVQQPQQQQHAQQPSMGLMQPQSQHNQLQQSQQHLMSQFQSQPNQLQQQLGMQQQPSMQQRLQTSAGMLLQQNNIDQQKQFIQSQRGLQEVSSSTSVDSTAQTGHAGAGDWQEEIYQMVKSLKDQYFAELSELYNKISVKLQQVDSMIPSQKPPDQYEKMKNFKIMLERTLQFLQINKNNIQPALRERVPQYEKQIINILTSQRRKPEQTRGQQQFQQSPGQAPSSNISQQQLPSQGLPQHDSHTNQMPQASLSSMSTGLQSSSAAGIQHIPAPPATNFGVPTTQQNVANAPQAGSNLEAAQGSNFNSLQHGSMSATLQQGSTGPMQSTMNAQQQASSSMLSHSSMSTMQPNANSMQANASSLQQLKQQQQEHHMMQNQQMKRQMFQQLQQKQMLQQQLPIQQQLQKHQQAQMQIPQLHSGNDVNELKVRQGPVMKTGIYQQHLGQRSNYYHQQLKQVGAFPSSSPQNLQASSPQISHHSPQVDQHNLLPSQIKTPLHSANSPFVPSPSPSVAPSPIPVDSDKPLSNISSLTTTGQAGHQQTSLAPQTQSIAVNTPGISASPLLAEFTSADGSQANIPTQVPTKPSAAERPLDRLLKALRTTPLQSLSAAVSDIGSVVSMIDRIAGSAPGNGSRAAVGEDLVAMTKCRLQARNFMTHDGSGTSKKMKRDTSAMPLNVSSAGSVNDSFKQSSAGSVNDSFKQTYSVDTPELQPTATSRVKWQKTEVNHALMEEIQEINQQLINTELHVCEDDAESFAATSQGAEGTVIKCIFAAVAVSPSLKSMFASAQMSPILPLRLLVPASYPKCSPVLLDKFPDEQRNSDDLSTKAKSKFGILLRGLPEPMSLREIARTWDTCARKVIAEYAQNTGGGCFSSSYGCWESCVGA